MFLLSETAKKALITKIAHNLAFEAMFSYKQGIVVQPPVYDTIAASQLTLKAPMEFRSLSDSGLKTLALNLCHEPLPSFTAVTAGRHFDELDPADPETIRYSCADSDFALRLYYRFNEWFDRYLPRHRWIVENLESPTAVFVGIMKCSGIPVDIPAMQAAKTNRAVYERASPYALRLWRRDPAVFFEDHLRRMRRCLWPKGTFRKGKGDLLAMQHAVLPRSKKLPG